MVEKRPISFIAWEPAGTLGHPLSNLDGERDASGPAAPSSEPPRQEGGAQGSPQASPVPNILPFPPDFYRGRARARRAALVVAVLFVGSLAFLAEVHLVDLNTLLGPHVARSEWAFTMSGARDLNALGWTGRGITVCLVDSGIDLLHPDFARLRLVAWKDLVNNKSEAYDDNGHGTSMAGLIAANGSLRGIAPDVSLVVVKVTNATGFGYARVAAEGIRFCLNPFGDGTRGADLISVSLGSSAPLFVDTEVSVAAQEALNRGVIVVAAAGNDGGPFDDGDVEIPANVPLAIGVGAVDASGRIAPFSSSSFVNRTDPNRKPEIVGPGVQIISTAPGAHYLTLSGTSPATAVTAGVVALLLQAHPELRPAGSTANVLALKWALIGFRAPGPGYALPHDPWYGYGLLDGKRALAYLS